MCTQLIKKINLISRTVGDTSWSCILAWYATLRVWHHQTLPNNNLRHLDIILHLDMDTGHTPSYKKTILESKQPVSGINLFFRFSPRLSKNDYSQIKFIAKFVTTASNVALFWPKLLCF